ncbi:MAG: DNA alkylation repair protein [Bacteroidetes bacterium]|jgi:3-methyladenine DNA glycosylase AlkD|nr:DNA alkylation repair protein [Bacteroidota bacterium]MBT5529132.1 DNA alkylation repair protein [Cytophagia bacterium]MBT3421567.1 DNA alkylation repair protein [Bacteroidota bacterium]MBT3800910.1 DNA alkylation repair protein [Bacteroidota bacterium]MBT3935341.1 DNA alkylation repair protein [Bacteroidota bacterium]
MTTKEILSELKEYGDEQTKNTYIKHGAKEPLFGVKVQDLKKILKKTKKNHELSLELYATGNHDAMYLAALMADEKQITKEQLELWVSQAYWSYLSEYAVPWVAAETEYGFELGLKWIQSDIETVASAGWGTLAYYAAVNDDEKLDTKAYLKLLDTVEKEIHDAQNRVRYTMNGFVIAVGTYFELLTEKSKEVAKRIGKVSVDVGGTACKVPLANDYIDKVIAKGRVGVKRKTARC